MEVTHPIPASPPIATQTRALRRFTLAFSLLLALTLLALAVPFLNVNRLQRRTARSLAESLGRPVHFDRISLALLPLPGLTIENLVVGEDPAFGAEPFIRANQVRATLRFSSLWRRRVEFSRIAFTDPSINLVKLPDGRWNLESILLQAARIDAAPTAQRTPSAAPRFPYIEATDARLNLKLGPHKSPISLTEAECALWLPSPSVWQLRLDGRPMRTDTPVSETGTFHLEGTLGRASSWTAVPLDLKAAWRNVPLGEASRFLLARDAGLRGTFTLAAAATGTIGTGNLQASLHLNSLRRADFVPAHPLSLDAECLATQTASFHAFTDLRCTWPPTFASNLPFAPQSETKTLALTGTVPDIRHIEFASVDLGTPGIPAETLLNWLHIASPRVDPTLAATGVLSGTAFVHPAAAPDPGIAAQFTLTHASLTLPALGLDPIFAGDIALHSTQADKSSPVELVLSPLELNLGARTPVILDARFSPNGYMLHLSGTASRARLLAFAASVPQIGDGLAEAIPVADAETAIHLDLTSSRAWTGLRTWQAAPAVPVHTRVRGRR